MAFIGVAKHICSYESATEFVVKTYYELNELPGLKTVDGGINLELFAFAKRDLHIFFTEKKDFNGENTYIIVGKYNIHRIHL